MASNPILKFLFGQKLADKNVSFESGTMYLDTHLNEMWYDDPSNTLTKHTKVIDRNTLVYSIEDSFEYPGEILAGETSAVLGVAKLGTMILGTS